MEALISVLQSVRRWGQRIGPYVIIEIVMPGGTLVALMLFLYRRRALGRPVLVAARADH